MVELIVSSLSPQKKKRTYRNDRGKYKFGSAANDCIYFTNYDKNPDHNVFLTNPHCLTCHLQDRTTDTFKCDDGSSFAYGSGYRI